MKAPSLPSKSIDKNYLLRLLNGNNEMVETVLVEIQQNIPLSLSEIDSCIKVNDYLGVITFSSRVKSAFFMIGEAELAHTFEALETAARRGEVSAMKNLFESTFQESLEKINLISEAV